MAFLSVSAKCFVFFELYLIYALMCCKWSRNAKMFFVTKLSVNEKNILDLIVGEC